MRVLRCSLLVVGLVLAACDSDATHPAGGLGATSSTTTTVDPTTTGATEPDAGSGDGLGESVGVTDEVTITVLDHDG